MGTFKKYFKYAILRQRRGDWEAEGAGFENRSPGNWTVGSNPTLSARKDFARKSCPPRFARRLICMGFLAKKKCFYQTKYGSSRFVLEMLSFPTYLHSAPILSSNLGILRTHELVRAKTRFRFRFRRFPRCTRLFARAISLFVRPIPRQTRFRQDRQKAICLTLHWCQLFHFLDFAKQCDYLILLSARPYLARAKLSRCLGSAKKFFEESFLSVR